MKYDFCMSRAEYNELIFCLTDEEKAVLDLRRRGRGNAEIAAELHCCERTVNRHVRSIRDKMQSG